MENSLTKWINGSVRKMRWKDEPRTVTLGEVLDSIESNGLNQITGAYLDFGDTGKIVGACAIGQAAYNLKIDYDELAYKLNDFNNLGTRIIKMNDNRGRDYKYIAKYYRKEFKDVLDHELDFNKTVEY